MEPVDAGEVGPPLQGLVQRVIAEPLAAVPEPQRRRRRPVDGPCGLVGIGRWRPVLGPNGTVRPLPPFPRRTTAEPRVRSTSSTVIATTSPARAPVSTISRTIASSLRSRRSLPSHALSSLAISVLGEHRHDLDVQLGRLRREQLVLGDLPLLGEPRRESAHRQMPGPCGRRFGAGVQQRRDERVNRRPVETGSAPVPHTTPGTGAPRRRTPSPFPETSVRRAVQEPLVSSAARSAACDGCVIPDLSIRMPRYLDSLRHAMQAIAC